MSKESTGTGLSSESRPLKCQSRCGLRIGQAWRERAQSLALPMIGRWCGPSRHQGPFEGVDRRGARRVEGGAGVFRHHDLGPALGRGWAALLVGLAVTAACHCTASAATVDPRGQPERRGSVVDLDQILERFFSVLSGYTDLCRGQKFTRISLTCERSLQLS
jgi:hypothetical protein